MSSKYLVILLMLIAPALARAQDRPIDSLPDPSGVVALRSAADTEQPAGPMTIERVRSGVLIAPDFKVTRFDGRTSELVGGYGGWLSDQNAVDAGTRCSRVGNSRTLRLWS